MKVLVTGAKGQLGYDVVKTLKGRGMECLAADIEDFDITDTVATESFIVQHCPDAVIHCAAYTAVDKAEDEIELCRKINALGTENIAAACKKVDAKMLYISTDYVFSGEGDKPFEVDDTTGPLGVYGQTKFEGEQAVKRMLIKYYIVRTSWVFGKNGNNFVKTMLRLAQERDQVDVVYDQIGSPTYTEDLAPLLCDMIASERYGTVHATNEGFCSWAEFAKKIYSQAGFSTMVNFITSDKYQTVAERPKNSRLSKLELDRNGFVRLPDWQDALKRFLSTV